MPKSRAELVAQAIALRDDLEVTLNLDVPIGTISQEARFEYQRNMALFGDIYLALRLATFALERARLQSPLPTCTCPQDQSPPIADCPIHSM